MLVKIRYSLITVILTFFLLTSCSSTTQSDRYNKPKSSDENESKSSVRFTSKDKSKESTDTFANVGDSLAGFDEIPVEDHPVNTNEIIDRYSKHENLSAALTTREKILFEIITLLDTPYLYGGVSENGIDCSAFTQQVFSNSVGVDLPRTAHEQFNIGESVGRKNDLKFGDLLFFNTTTRSYPGHVGIYIGENLFAHASRSLGVTVSSLKSTYYDNRFIGARRVN